MRSTPQTVTPQTVRCLFKLNMVQHPVTCLEKRPSREHKRSHVWETLGRNVKQMLNPLYGGVYGIPSITNCLHTFGYPANESSQTYFHHRSSVLGSSSITRSNTLAPRRTLQQPRRSVKRRAVCGATLARSRSAVRQTAYEPGKNGGDRDKQAQ